MDPSKRILGVKPCLSTLRRILELGLVGLFLPRPQQVSLPVATQAVRDPGYFPLMVVSLAVSLLLLKPTLDCLILWIRVSSPCLQVKPSLGQQQVLPVGLVQDSPASDSILLAWGSSDWF